jgi:hypothetical protein
MEWSVVFRRQLIAVSMTQGTDGLLYAVDTSRLFPPEFRKGVNPGARQMYQLLRPELLRKVQKPLVPDALRYTDEGARRDLAEVSNMLDVEIAALAQELALGQHLGNFFNRRGAKNFLHSRGLNMRHLREVLARLDADSLQALHVHTLLHSESSDNGDHKEEVKTLTHPQTRSEEELRAVLELQRESCRSGGDWMALVPTLLVLSDAVGDGIQMGKEMLREFGGEVGRTAFRPAGPHPLAEAWAICEMYDGELQKSAQGIVTACSELSLLVMYEILRRDDSFYCPCEKSLYLVTSQREQTALTSRVRRYARVGVGRGLGGGGGVDLLRR